MSHTSFKQFLRESATISASNVQQLAGAEVSNLTDRVEFQRLKELDPVYAEKLQVAWEGDAKEYARLGAQKFTPLFAKLVAPDVVKRLSKLKVDHAVELDLNKLLALHSQTFRVNEKPKNSMNNDVWSHVEWAREARTKAYESLLAEVEALVD